MKKAINTKKAPLPVGPYNQAVLVDKTLYISGQVALNPENNELIQGSIEDETNQIMKNIKSILNEAGLDFNNVVRSKIYLTDMNNFSKVNQVYGSYFEKNHEPARTTLEVSGLPLGVDVEIDMIAVSID
jgi:2-iminobutanoate/2-iminopropanoate deaminase